MKDVLLVTPYYEPNIVGGAEISTQLIAEGLAGRADVLTFGRDNGKRTVNGIDVHEINLRCYENLWAQPLDGTRLSVPNKLAGHFCTFFPRPSIKNLYRDFICKNGYRTVIMNANETVMDRASLWKGARDSGVRVILTLRDPSLLTETIGKVNLNKPFRALIRRQLDWIDTFVAPSQYMLDLYAQYEMTCTDSHVIPNAVAPVSVCDVPFEEKHGVLYVGTLSENKGVRTLLAACSKLRRRETLTLAGRGPLAEECQTEGAECLGWIPHEEAVTKMSRARVVVLPSEWPEAFGRTLIEAVGAGTLVVGSDAGAIPEVLGGDGRYLFAAGDSRALAERVDRICSLSKERYAAELGELRRKFERYSLESYVEAWEGLLDDN